MNTLSAECYSKKGFVSMKAGEYKQAAEHFRKALELDRERSRKTPEMRYLSYYGFNLARAGLSESIALQACLAAVNRQRQDPILYLNLARVYALTGKRVPAIRALNSGLRVAPDHDLLRRELAAIDRRARPVIPFLDRSHPLNRRLGRIRALRRGGQLAQSA